jgi:flavin reductase (DIM6/NTAB) family NADH-FMN oxidoreductase RutF
MDGQWCEPNDTKLFRNVVGCFATGVTVITGEAPDGERFGLTASSFQSVSLDPPLVSYNVRRGAASVAILNKGRRFAINVLHETQSEIACRFASPLRDRFAGIRFQRGELGSPLLEGVIAALECELWATYDGGDHLIVVGRVVRMRREATGKPLLFYCGEFRPIGAESAGAFG